MAEPTVVLSDASAENLFTDFSNAAALPAEAVSYLRRGKHGTWSERKREAGTHMSQHPCRRPEGGGRRGWASRRAGTAAPQHVGFVARTGTDERGWNEGKTPAHGKTEDCGEEIRSPKKRDTSEGSEGRDRKLRAVAWTRFRAGELVVGTFNVRTLAFNGKDGYARNYSRLRRHGSSIEEA